MAVKIITTKKGGPVQGGEKKAYTVDAQGRALGRVATEVAAIVLGKASSQYVQNEVLPVSVTVINASKMKLNERRVAQKDFTHYTGSPGGLRHTSMQKMMDTKGITEVLRKAIDGMIPRNKLRKERMKRVTIND